MLTYSAAICKAVEKGGLLSRQETAKQLSALGLSNKGAFKAAVKKARAAGIIAIESTRFKLGPNTILPAHRRVAYAIALQMAQSELKQKKLAANCRKKSTKARNTENIRKACVPTNVLFKTRAVAAYSRASCVQKTEIGVL